MFNIKKLNLKISSRSQDFLNNIKDLTIDEIKKNQDYFKKLNFENINNNLEKIEKNLIDLEDKKTEILKLKILNKELFSKECEKIYRLLLNKIDNNSNKTFSQPSSKKYILKNIKDILNGRIIIN